MLMCIGILLECASKLWTDPNEVNLVCHRVGSWLIRYESNDQNCCQLCCIYCIFLYSYVPNIHVSLHECRWTSTVTSWKYGRQEILKWETQQCCASWGSLSRKMIESHSLDSIIQSSWGLIGLQTPPHTGGTIQTPCLPLCVAVCTGGRIDS